MAEDSLEAIDLSIYPFDRCEWNPVPSYLSFCQIWFNLFYFLLDNHGYDSPNYFSHRLKLRHGFQTCLKFLSKNIL
jgi:hypothetical protein